MSQRHRDILVWMDGSEASGYALSESIRLAMWTRGRVTAAAAIPPFEGDLDLMGVKHPQEVVEGSGYACLEMALDIADAMNFHLETARLFAYPEKTLPLLAESLGTDLLVLGVGGPFSILELMAGGLETALLKRCPLDMLFIPYGIPCGWEEIRFAVMGPKAENSEGMRVIDLAASYGGKLRTCAVACRGVPGFRTACRNENGSRERWREFLDEMEAGATARGVPHSTLELGEDSLAGLSLPSAEAGGRVIVTGREGKVGLRGLLSGFSLDRLVHRARCPVLVLGNPRAGMLGAGRKTA